MYFLQDLSFHMSKVSGGKGGIIIYLEKYIGYNVAFKLREEARQDTTMKQFFNSAEFGGYIQNQLVAVDQLGMWVKGSLKTSVHVDENGKNLENPKKEWIDYHILVRWEYLEGTYVVDNPSVNEKRIGFGQKG